MKIARRLARPLIAAAYVDAGIDMARTAKDKAPSAEPVVNRLREPLKLTQDTETLVKANGAAMAASGLLFGLGRMPRATAVVMMATMIPTTIAGHAFWKAPDATERKHQRDHFLKNVSLVGGALLAAVDTEGKPGLTWRSKRAAKDARKAASRAAKDAKTAVHR